MENERIVTLVDSAMLHHSEWDRAAKELKAKGRYWLFHWPSSAEDVTGSDWALNLDAECKGKGYAEFDEAAVAYMKRRKTDCGKAIVTFSAGDIGDSEK